ncbi:MAG: hypothetical protein WBM00_06360 [Solirubrobacterales bacterium]
MSLDGLRAWIGEVERKLTMRTRVFLVLATIAIAGAGAAIYLAVDAHNKTVTEGDLQALQKQLEGQIGEAGGSTGVAALEAEVKELQEQVEQLDGGAAKEKGTGESSNQSGSAGGSETGSNSSEGSGGNGASTGASEGSGGETPSTGTGSAKLQELVEQAKEQAEKSK